MEIGISIVSNWFTSWLCETLNNFRNLQNLWDYVLRYRCPLNRVVNGTILSATDLTKNGDTSYMSVDRLFFIFKTACGYFIFSCRYNKEWRRDTMKSIGCMSHTCRINMRLVNEIGVKCWCNLKRGWKSLALAFNKFDSFIWIIVTIHICEIFIIQPWKYD